jgi:hypothetical protein
MVQGQTRKLLFVSTLDYSVKDCGVRRGSPLASLLKKGYSWMCCVL